MNTTDISRYLAPHTGSPLFHAALEEFLVSVVPYMTESGCTDGDFARLSRLITPERTITFRVTWENDHGALVHNTGYRVQFNSVLGPYKGGLRFDPSVSLDVLSFLGFEQIFKNALTGLPLGGGKGGSDFNPKGKSDAEIRRFCYAFMSELARYIGADTDVPAGDIGVGAREIGYLYGAYKKITNSTTGVVTGKGVGYGGSYIRTEATGYGAVYFIEHMLTASGDTIVGKRAVISGSGNVATHVAEKLIQKGAIACTLSDREGYIYASEGLSQESVKAVKVLKARGETLSEFVCPAGVTYMPGSVWGAVPGDIMIPSATQHEVTHDIARYFVDHGVQLVAEAANMPCTLDAVAVLQETGVRFGPAKAVNAGGVAVSGLEMSQNAARLSWSSEDVDARLQSIMEHIHSTCVQYGKHTDGTIDYVQGANIGGFLRVFDAMKQLGW